MEWYMSDRLDDVVVPSDQCAQSSFALQNRRKQWGLNTIDEGYISLDNPYVFGNSVDDEGGDFSCEALVDVDQLQMDHVVGEEGDQAEISGVCGGISESSNCWTEILNNQDYLLDGFPWTNQTDENFLNSLLEEDLHASDQFHIYGSPNSHGTYSTMNNLTTDMLLDSHDIGSYEQMGSPKFPYIFDWDRKQSEESHHNLQSMMIGTASQNNAPVEKVPRQVCTDWIDSENPSVEETVLQEFGSALQKMTDKSRLCFRDALYRLATHSEKKSSVFQGEHGGSISSEMPIKTAPPDQTLRFMDKDATEHRTNTIDKTIAELLFNKPPQHGDCHQYHPKQSQLTQQPVFIKGR